MCTLLLFISCFLTFRKQITFVTPSGHVEEGVSKLTDMLVDTIPMSFEESCLPLCDVQQSTIRAEDVPIVGTPSTQDDTEPIADSETGQIDDSDSEAGDELSETVNLSYQSRKGTYRPAPNLDEVKGAVNDLENILKPP